MIVMMLHAFMLVTGVTHAVVAWRTDNDPVLWAVLGFFVPFVAVFFLPGMLNRSITRIGRLHRPFGIPRSASAPGRTQGCLPAR